MSEPPTPREARIVRPPSTSSFVSRTQSDVDEFTRDTYGEDKEDTDILGLENEDLADTSKALPLFNKNGRDTLPKKGTSLKEQMEDLKREQEVEESFLRHLSGKKDSSKQKTQPPSRKKQSSVNTQAQPPPVNKSIPSTHRAMTAAGSIEELQCLIGRIKARYFNAQRNSEISSTSSRKMFYYARMTQIQEALNDLTTSLLTTSTYDKVRYERTRFSSFHTQELVNEMRGVIRENNTSVVPGTTELEADLLIARAVAHRVERQLQAAVDPKIGIELDVYGLEYIQKLSVYLNSLAIHIVATNTRSGLKT
jgi:cob(I)alamin adenosyltransferase